MSGQTYAIQLKTPASAEPRFFYAFGKDNSVRTAWSLAGATLFLNHERLGAVLRELETKGKDVVLVGVGVTHVAADLEVCPF